MSGYPTEVVDLPLQGLNHHPHCRLSGLPNYTPYEMDELRSNVVEELDRLKESPDLLKSLVRFTKLSLEL
jgi:hypothetical protein